MGIRRRSLTLIELFVCLAVLASIGSFILVKGRPMIRHIQFKNSIGRLEQELEWSRRTAMNAGGEINMILTQKKGKIQLVRHTDEPLGYKGGNTRCILDHIPRFEFDGKACERLLLTYSRRGILVQAGELTIYSPDHKLIYNIKLPPKDSLRIVAKKGRK